MSNSVADPSAATPVSLVHPQPPEGALISDEELQALLCLTDALPWVGAVVGDKRDTASKQGSLS